MLKAQKGDTPDASSSANGPNKGGHATSDGPDAVQTHGQNAENAPIEETKINLMVAKPVTC